MKSLSRLLSALLCLLIISCKEAGNEQKLIGKWQEVAVINPKLDETIQNQRTFTDTVGISTDSMQNLAIYGTENIDTMKDKLKKNLDSFRQVQYYAVQATWFDFRKDGLMYIHSIKGLDSGNWYLDDDGALILDEAKLKGSGGKKRMEIIAVSDTGLKLQFTEKFISGIAVFKPVKK